MNYTGTIDQWSEIVFSNCASNPTFYTKDLYVNDVLVTTATLATASKISDYAFYNCESLKDVVIGNSVTSIGNYAFSYCASLESIVIGEKVTSIGKNVFLNCISLKDIRFEDSSTWYRTTSSTDWENKTYGTQTSVITSTTNATYFTLDYYEYYWYKK